MTDDIDTQRRRVLLVAGGVAAAGLAGCLGAPTRAQEATNTPTGGPSSSGGSTGQMLVVHDTVVSGDGGLGPGQADCALTNRFYKGQLAVFRAQVIDPSTGQGLTDEDLQAVNVKISNGGGSTVPMTYRLPPSDLNGTKKYWIGLWSIPTTFPAGPVDYAIEVTGSASQSVTFGVPDAEMTVLDQEISAVKQPESS